MACDPSRFVKLLMTYLVSHEETDLVETNLEYHLGRGVDFIVATANNAPDSTLGLLERYVAEGLVHLIVETADDYSQQEWVTRMARLASTEFEADWIVNLDADEYLWPEGGTLKDVFAAVPPEYGVLPMPVTNFVPRPEGRESFLERMTVRQVVTILETGKVHRPKVAHRAAPDLEVGRGSLGLVGEDFARVPGWEPITLLHFPLRSYEQFERKVSMAGATLSRNADFQAGLIREREIRARTRLLEEGRLHESYASQVVDDLGARAGIEAGRLVVDERLRDHLGKGDSEAARRGVRVDENVVRGLRVQMRQAAHRFEHDPRERQLNRLQGRVEKGERAVANLERRLEKCEERREQMASRLVAVEQSRWWKLRRVLLTAWRTVTLRSAGR